MDGLKLFYVFKLTLTVSVHLFYCQTNLSLAEKNCKGRYFQNTRVDSLDALSQFQFANEFICSEQCRRTEGCIAAEYGIGPASNCRIFNLTNIKHEFQSDNNYVIILLLPFNCGENSTVNGNWSDWAQVDDCSATCGGGIQTVRRTCSNPIPTCNGAVCKGSPQKVISCNEDACLYPVEGEWESWSLCSGGCGSGSKGRNKRTCTSTYCLDHYQSTQCDRNDCPISSYRKKLMYSLNACPFSSNGQKELARVNPKAMKLIHYTYMIPGEFYHAQCDATTALDATIDCTCIGEAFAVSCSGHPECVSSCKSRDQDLWSICRIN